MSFIDTYHTYVFVDPVTAISWFRPPIDQLLTANDLEIYTTRIDAFGLLTLAAILLVLSDAVTLPKSLVGSAFTVPASEKGKKPYARAVIVLTLFHHIATGMGSFSHWIKPTHRTLAMDIGVFVNIALVVLGAAALAFGLNDDTSAKTPKKATIK